MIDKSLLLGATMIALTAASPAAPSARRDYPSCDLAQQHHVLA